MIDVHYATLKMSIDIDSGKIKKILFFPSKPIENESYHLEGGSLIFNDFSDDGYLKALFENRIIENEDMLYSNRTESICYIALINDNIKIFYNESYKKTKELVDLYQNHSANHVSDLWVVSFNADIYSHFIS